MVGLVTLVIIRVDSVTSTCLRSRLGDMTTFSAPMPPGSSGTLPVQSSTTWGLSGAATDPARHKPSTSEYRISVAPGFKLARPRRLAAGVLLHRNRAGQPPPFRPPPEHAPGPQSRQSPSPPAGHSARTAAPAP